MGVKSACRNHTGQGMNDENVVLSPPISGGCYLSMWFLSPSPLCYSFRGRFDPALFPLTTVLASPLHFHVMKTISLVYLLPPLVVFHLSSLCFSVYIKGMCALAGSSCFCWCRVPRLLALTYTSKRCNSSSASCCPYCYCHLCGGDLQLVEPSTSVKTRPATELSDQTLGFMIGG